MLRPYFVKSGAKPLTSDERNSIRSKNGNTHIITDSGNEYKPPGLGSMSSGLPMNSLRESGISISFISAIQESNKKLIFDENYRLKTNEV